MKWICIFAAVALTLLYFLSISLIGNDKEEDPDNN